MVKRSKHAISDTDLFQQEMADVVPLKPTLTTDSIKPRRPAHRRRPDHSQDEFSWPDASASSGHRHDQAGIDDEDGSSHRKNGVQIRMVRKLKRGQFPLSREIDLHHMTTETAHRVLLEFLADAQTESLECVRIIHGKGLRSENGPRLRTMTRQVLRDHRQVLAFTACKQGDGGSGATDVLLKPA